MAYGYRHVPKDRRHFERLMPPGEYRVSYGTAATPVPTMPLDSHWIDPETREN
ncbi:MAG: hypothetical protein ACLQFR_27755 [Streptosporangiaceae bacterium]